MRLAALILFVFFVAPALARADRSFSLLADAALVESGALDYLLPRFSLKTQIKVHVVRAGSADAALAAVEAPAAAGREAAVFQTVDGGRVYRLTVHDGPAAEHAGRFLDWLTSEVGQRAVTRFDPGGGPIFVMVEEWPVAVVAAEPTGDASVGEQIAFRRCGRCHVIGERNKFGGIGSTPSFGALRGLPRWRERFEAFWALNPHPAFTQIAGVTEAFDPQRPPPIAPLELTLEEVDAILAFVIAMKPKDLGAPLVLD